MSFYSGIDIGASATKAVVIDDSTAVVGAATIRTGVDLPKCAGDCLDAALETASLGKEDLACVVATGFGRHNVPFADDNKTEISCHAKGCYHHFPQAITIVDIGGQDNKVITLDDAGKTVDFKMNRKCAAGTGAFLEEIAERLDVEVSQINPLASSTEETVELGSFCTVFTKTEILARMREGKSLPELLRGALDSVAKRVVEMAALTGDIVVSGGVVAHNPLVVDMLEKRAGVKTLVPPAPQTMGAFGAALFARTSRTESETKSETESE